MESEKEEGEENDDDKPPPLPTSPLPKDPELPVPATERLLGQPAAAAPAPATSTFVTTRYEERVDGEDDIPPLPVELEQVNPRLYFCVHHFCP